MIISPEVVCKSNYIVDHFNLDIILLLFFKGKNEIYYTFSNEYVFVYNITFPFNYIIPFLSILLFIPKNNIVIMLFIRFILILVFVNFSEMHTILFPLQKILNFN